MSDRRCLVVYTKPAVPGRVKTRLIGALSAEQAAELHLAFYGDLLEKLENGAFSIQIAWDVDEPEPLPDSRFPGFRQVGSDLGERLFRGLSMAAQNFSLVAAVGSDHPELQLSHVYSAFDKLAAGTDMVLGPAADGGYYLIGIGVDRLGPELFADIDWSTERVLETQIAKCREQGLSVALLTPADDVDTPQDLERLAARLQKESDTCPRTRRLLESWGWMST